MRKYKIAFLFSHPTQYHAPFFRYLGSQPDFDLTVYFCTRWGLDEKLDPGFGKTYKWDIPLLEGYRAIFLKNRSPWPRPYFFGQINFGILAELKKQKFDALVVHGYTGFTNWLAFWGCWFTKTPLILEGEADFGRGINPIKGLLKRAVLVPLFRFADAVFYTYTQNKRFFEFYGVPEEKLFFRPCSVDNDFFQSKAKELGDDKVKLRKKLGVKNPELPSILYSGKFIPRKRVGDLLEAHKILTTENLQLKTNVFLVGDGPQREELESFVKKNNLENVYFFGFKNQTELPLFYAASDIFVLPSEWDPSPKALNEAMNFSLPIIVTDGVGTAPDLVLGGKTGFIYPVGDTKQLSYHIEKLLGSSSLREDLGRNAKNLVKEWSFDKVVEGTRAALEYIARK